MQGGNFSIYRVRSHAEDIAVESTFGLYHRLIIAGNAAWRTWVTVTQKSQSAPVTFAPADPYLDKYLASNKSSTQLSHAYINTPPAYPSRPLQPTFIIVSIRSIHHASLYHHSNRPCSRPPSPRLGRRLPKLAGRRKRAMRQILRWQRRVQG
jgi:hypothetical protein